MKYSLLDLDDFDIADGKWSNVLENLRNAFPDLKFKKSSYENRISIYATNIPDDCCLQFDEGASCVERYHLRVFVKKNGKFVEGLGTFEISYEGLFNVIERYLEV